MKHLIILFTVLLLASCQSKREQLNSNVTNDIITNTQKNGKSIEVLKELVLVNKEDNLYQGTMECVIDSDTTTLYVEVVFDGEAYEAKWGTAEQMMLRKGLETLFGL